MLDSLPGMLRAFLHLVFPHNCCCCGLDLPDDNEGICSGCMYLLPQTGYHLQAGNPVEQIFWGRVPLQHAAATCFFTKRSRVQQLLHAIKYHHRSDAGWQLGQWMGHQLLSAPWISEMDGILPMPLHERRQRERGYNQAALLSSGMSQVLGIPTYPDAIARKAETASQTRQQRSERWENMQQVFEVRDAAVLEGKHLLLVDDVVTTGATLEAMCLQLLQVSQVRLSVYCFAYTLPH